MILRRFTPSTLQRTMPDPNSLIPPGLASAYFLHSSVLPNLGVRWQGLYSEHCSTIRGLLNSSGQEESLSCLYPGWKWIPSTLTTEWYLCSSSHSFLDKLQVTMSFCLVFSNEHLLSFSSCKLRAYTHTFTLLINVFIYYCCYYNKS